MMKCIFATPSQKKSIWRPTRSEGILAFVYVYKRDCFKVMFILLVALGSVHLYAMCARYKCRFRLFLTDQPSAFGANQLRARDLPRGNAKTVVGISMAR